MPDPSKRQEQDEGGLAREVCQVGFFGTGIIAGTLGFSPKLLPRELRLTAILAGVGFGGLGHFYCKIFPDAKSARREFAKSEKFNDLRKALKVEPGSQREQDLLDLLSGKASPEEIAAAFIPDPQTYQAVLTEIRELKPRSASAPGGTASAPADRSPAVVAK